MKKIIILVLALAGATGSVLSQQTTTITFGTPTTRSELMFSGYQLNSSRIRFDFNLANTNRMRLEFTALSQIDSLPPIDSLLTQVKKALSLINDTITDPLFNKRVDYVAQKETWVRIKSYPPAGNAYSFRNQDLNTITELKVEQDTLKIHLFTMDQLMILDNRERRKTGRPYSVTFFLNNLSDLENIPVDKLNATIDILKAEIAPSKAKEKKYPGVTYYALYDVETQKKLRTWLRSTESKKVKIGAPYVQSGFQFMRGVGVPSVGAGIELIQKKNENNQREWRLMWEPLFFFSRDAGNKLIMDRNDFITFKQHSKSKFKSLNKEIEFVQNLSFGYLINRNGNWLEKNTFKFSLPTGIQYKNILLEPEFLFNDLFKNFSPTMKLTVIFE
jgi:hypothetical protein